MISQDWDAAFVIKRCEVWTSYLPKTVADVENKLRK